MNNYEEAKKIYFAHNGNYFFMDRGDYPLLEKYKSFNVPKELEEQWDEEIKQNYISQIDREKDFTQIHFLCSNLLDISLKTKDFNGLSYVYALFAKNRKNYDCIMNIRMIEIIFKHIPEFSLLNETVSIEIGKKVLNFLEEIKNKYRDCISTDKKLYERVIYDEFDYVSIYNKLIKNNNVVQYAYDLRLDIVSNAIIDNNYSLAGQICFYVYRNNVLLRIRERANFPIDYTLIPNQGVQFIINNITYSDIFRGTAISGTPIFIKGKNKSGEIIIKAKCEGIEISNIFTIIKI